MAKNSNSYDNLRMHITNFEEKEDIYIFVYFGVYFNGLKKYDIALKYFNLVLIDYPNDIRTLLNKALTLKYLNKKIEYSLIYKKYNILNESYMEGIKKYLKFAEECYLFGDYTSSIEFCNFILEVYPKNSYALNYKQQVLYSSNWFNKRCSFKNCWTYYIDKNKL